MRLAPHQQHPPVLNVAWGLGILLLIVFVLSMLVLLVQAWRPPAWHTVRVSALALAGLYIAWRCARAMRAAYTQEREDFRAGRSLMRDWDRDE